jgi:spore germination protein YaaH
VRALPHARRIPSAGLALVLAVALLPTAAVVREGPTADAAPTIRSRITGIKPLSHEVYGYLPYWRLDAKTAGRIDYRLVSTIAFFGLGIKSSGAISRTWVGYKEYVGRNAAAVTNAAHANGVRVVPTFQLFDMAEGAPRMTKFLGSTARQDRFIREALDLMAARKADGAGLDFEPVRAVNARASQFVAFVARFRAAMKARFPDATLVNATSAGANQTTVEGLAPHVDHQMIMTYNYRWRGSTTTGAVAPLDHAARNVKLHIDKMLQWAPAESILMGVPYYGYDWPVTKKVPNAPVRSNKKKYGAVKAVTYASARKFLKAHPKVKLRYDALEGSAYYTYWSKKYKTYRQVYFDDGRSLAAKYDYVIEKGLAGVGIWTLGNDGTYRKLWNVLRSRFYKPVRAMTVVAPSVAVREVGAAVDVRVRARGTATGTVPERGRFRWTIRDTAGRLIERGSWPRQTLYPGRLAKRGTWARIGLARELAAGTYVLRVRFVTSSRTWRAPAVEFDQPY